MIAKNLSDPATVPTLPTRATEPSGGGRSGCLAGLPWYAGFLFGEVLFAVLKWIVPALCADDPVLCRQAGAVAGLAWAAAGLCMLFGVHVAWPRCRSWVISRHRTWLLGGSTPAFARSALPRSPT